LHISKDALLTREVYPNSPTIAVMPDDCLFCKIVSGDVPATVVRDGARALAIRDVSPQAPVHVLIIPRDHHDTAAKLAAESPDVLVEVHRLAAAVAEELGVDESGYRLVYNTGPDAQQSVQHVHLHLLAGRPLTWPPG